MKNENKELMLVPNSPIISTIMAIAANKFDLEKFKDRHKLVNHEDNLEIYETKTQKVILINPGTPKEYAISFSSLLGGSNNNVNAFKNTLKFYLVIFSNLYKQCFINGSVIRDELSIPLSEFIRLGMYSSMNTARPSITRLKTELSMISIHQGSSGANLYNKDNVLFYSNEIKNSTLKIKINTKVPWQDILKNGMYVPAYIYKLSSPAAGILYGICDQVRRNVDKSPVTMSYRMIIERSGLPLPAEIQNRRYAERLINPINQAITEIEDQEARQENQNLYLYQNEPGPGTKINELIQNSSLEITVIGEMQKHLDGIHEKKKNHKKPTKKH